MDINTSVEEELCELLRIQPELAGYPVYPASSVGGIAGAATSFIIVGCAYTPENSAMGKGEISVTFSTPALTQNPADTPDTTSPAEFLAEVFAGELSGAIGRGTPLRFVGSTPPATTTSIDEHRHLRELSFTAGIVSGEFF